MGMHVRTKQLPASLQSALSSVGYKAADIEVRAATERELCNVGGRGRYSIAVAVNLETGARTAVAGSYGGQNPSERTSLDKAAGVHSIPVNGAMIEGSKGYKGTWLTVYVHPSNMPVLIPDEGASLSEDQLTALAIIRGLKSSYRRECFERNGLGPYNVGSPLIDGLVSGGYLKANKAGSLRITTEGKNAVGDRRAPY